MVNTMASDLVTFVLNTLHDLWCQFCKVASAEEGSTDVIRLQYVEDAIRTLNGYLHTLFKGEVYPMFTWYIKLFRIEA